MEKLRNSIAAKVVSVILIAVLTTVFVFSAVALAFGVAEDLYSESGNKLEQLNSALEGNLYLAMNYITGRTDIANEIFPDVSGNLMYEIKDENGEILYSNVDESQSMLSYSENRCFSNYIYGYFDSVVSSDEKIGEEVETTEDSVTQKIYEKVNYTITIHLKKELKEKDIFYYISQIYNFIADNEKMLVTSSVISSLVILALFVFLMCSAGHKNGFEGISLSRLDKFPYDIAAVLTAGLCAAIFCIAVAVTEDLNYSYFYNNNSIIPFIPPFYALTVMAVSILLTVFCITSAVRLKTKTLIKSTLAFKILRFIFKQFKRLFSFIGYTLRKIPTVWKAAVSIFGVFMVNFILILITASGGDGAVILLLFFDIAVAVSAVLFCIMFSDIKSGTEKIANGNTEEKINSVRMIGDLKIHAQNINSINDGIARAVEQKMKSERFKTELITNVSHDIKTPLTSIINYVDLLSKENIDNENAEEYIEVLSRQSSKLKKLIDDLLEASKASTGNLAVNFTKIEIGTLLSQTLGEYEDRFAEKQLEPVLNNYSQPIIISADNRHIWRIFDNIFNNIAKYAQDGTRVYIDVTEKGGLAEITFKNISKEKLNISGDELMERFVRGDSSRNTEGSGLGLSIAKSLAELQKGRCDVQIDGDLFKVKLTFPIVG